MRSLRPRGQRKVLACALLVAIPATAAPCCQTTSATGNQVSVTATPSATPSVMVTATSSVTLFQTTSHDWAQTIATWKADKPHSWTVSNGVLESTGKGRKLFSDVSDIYRYEALILAPYRVTAKRYAIDAEIRFSNPSDREGLAGIVFAAHKLSPSPAPLLVATSTGLFTNCMGRQASPGSLRRSAGLGLCLGGFLHAQGHPAIARYRDPGGWHLYRIEVRGRRYHLLIDGRSMETVTDQRPGADLGDRFGFFAAYDTAVRQHISVESVDVVTL